jgi:hypothetical protein
MVQVAHFFCLMPDMSSCQTIALCASEAHVSNRRSKDNTQSSWRAPAQWAILAYSLGQSEIPSCSPFISRITAAVKQKMPFDYDLKIHVYGQSGVMGRLEPDKTSIPKEVGICVQVRAATQAQANEVVNITRIHFVHAPYPNQLATAGNFAWPFTPCDIPMDPLLEFCIYHIMRVQDPLELFPIKAQTFLGDASHDSPKDWFCSFFAIFGD